MTGANLLNGTDVNMQETMRELERAWSSDGRVESIGILEMAERRLGVPLPADYKGFLMRSNGGATRKPLPRMRFYPLSDVLEYFEDGLPPRVIEFATDDSDGFGFDASVRATSAKYPVLRYPLGERTLESTELVADDFLDFLQRVLNRHPSVK
jgi:hypothetical protein